MEAVVQCVGLDVDKWSTAVSRALVADEASETEGCRDLVTH